VSLKVPGQTIDLVNSYQAASDMLEKRSSIYSERPTLTMCGELIGWDKALILSRGERHRTYRRLFHRIIGNHAHLKQFHPVEEEETLKFLRRVMEAPEQLRQHVRQYVFHYPLAYRKPRR
jgi:cytochrome P450